MLRARVLPSRGQRNGLWYWQIRNGTQAVSSGRMSREDCMRQMVEVATGIAAQVSAPRGAETVEDVISMWLGSSVDLRPEDDPTHKVYYMASRRLIAGMGEAVAGRVTRDTLARYIHAATQGGYAGSTIKLDLRVLSIAWKWAYEMGLTRTPLPRAPKVQARRRYVDRTPTWDDVNAVIDHLTLDHPAGQALLLQGAFGGRIGETTRIRHCDVDRFEGEGDTLTAWVWLRFTKTNRDRIVPIRRDAGALVAELHDPDRGEEHLLRYRSGRAAGRSVNARFGQAVRTIMYRLAWDDLGIERFSTHGIRRLVADTLRNGGVEVEEVAAMLGHSPEMLLRTYRRITPAAVLGASMRVGLGGRSTPNVVPLRAAAKGVGGP